MKSINIRYSKLRFIVDDEDYEECNYLNWYLRGKNSTNIYTHIPMTGIISLCNFLMKTKRVKYDHIDRNFLNNQKSNLRVCTDSQNNANRKYPNKTSKYRGVSWSVYGYWVAAIKFNKKATYIGSYHSEEEAAIAYNKKALELFGDFAVLNKV